MRTTRALVVLFVVSLLLLVASSPARATEVFWAAAASGNWNVASNWSPATVPGASDTARIEIAGTYTVTVNSAAEVARLALGAPSGVQTLLVTASTLTLNGASSVAPNGVLALQSATIAGPGPVDNQGTVHAQGNTSTLNGALTTAAGSNIRVAAISPFATVTLTVASGFTNNGTIVLSNDRTGSVEATLNVTSGTLTNGSGGSISVEFGAGTGGFRTLGAQLDNQGTVTVSHPLTVAKASADHVSSGSITVSGGDMTISQSGTTPSFTNTGAITVDPSRTFSVTAGGSGGVFDHLSGSLGGGGSLTLTNTTSSLATTLGVGALTMSGSSVTLGAPLSTATTVLSLSTTSTLNGAMVTNAAGRTLAISQSTINNAVQNEGLLHAQGNTSTLNGALTTAAGSNIRVAAISPFATVTLTVANGFTNNGTIVLSNDRTGSIEATLNVTSGTLTNAAGGSISVEFGAGTGGFRTLGAQLDNQGTVTVSHPLTVAKASADHVSSGSITVSGADITISQSGTTPSFTNTGAVIVSPSRTLSVTAGVTGGVFDHLSGSLGGGGSLTLTNTTSSLATALGLGALTMSGSSVTLGAPLSTATTVLSLSTTSTLNGAMVTNAAGRTLAISQSTINNALQNEGLLHAQGNTSTLNGTLTTAAGSNIRVAAIAPFATVALTVANGFTNDGTIVLSNDRTGAIDATLNVTSGTLTNAAGGSISVEFGTAGGVRTLGAQLDNQGTVTVSHPLTVAKASADHVSNGSITVSGGDVAISQSGTTPSFTNTGAITINPSRTLSVTAGASGCVFDHLSGSLGGGGSLALTNTTSSLATALGLGALTMSGSSVTLGAPLSTATTVLSLSTTSTLNGAMVTNAAGRTLAISQSTINNALQNEGLLHSQGNTSTLNGALTAAVGSNIRVAAIAPFATVALTVANGFTNDGAIVLSNDRTGAIDATLNVTSGTLTNAAGGSISVEFGTAGGVRTLGAQLDNQGTVTVSHPLTVAKASADHVSNGPITVSGGDMTISQSGTTPSFTNTGAITVNTSRTLTVTAGAFDQLAGTLAGDGVIVLSNVTSSFSTALGILALTISGGNATLTAPLTTSATGLTLTNSAILNGAALTNGPGQTLSIAQSTINNALENQGLLRAQGNTSTLNGPFTTVAGSTIRVAAIAPFATVTLAVANSFTNNGTIVLSNDRTGAIEAVLNVTSGTLTNAAGGVITSEFGAGTGGARTLGAQLDNQGLLMPSHPITISKTSADHVNRGSVEISGADLTISQSGTTPTFTNMGSIAIAAGRTVTVTGGVCENASAGTIRGAGTLVVSPSALVNAGILAPGASPATISITGAITSAPTSVLAFEIGGYTPGTEFDRIAVSGPVSLAGALDATLLGGFFPTLGDSFVVLTSSALSGGFSCLRGTEIGGGLAIEPRVRSTALVLAVVASTSTNTPPSASDDVANVTYDASVVVPVVANDMDADGDSIFVRSLDLTETMGTAVIDPDAQSITFTPLAFFVGPDTLRYLAGDCSGGSDEGVVIVNVGSPTGVEPPHEDEPTPAALPDAVDFTARLRSNGSAAIVLALPRDADVEIELFDAQGRRVSEILTSRMPAGRHELSWSDPRRASGVYFARLLARTDAGVVRRTARVLLVR